MKRQQPGHDGPHVPQATATAAALLFRCLLRDLRLPFRLALRFVMGPARFLARGVAVFLAPTARARLQRQAGLLAEVAQRNLRLLLHLLLLLLLFLLLLLLLVQRHGFATNRFVRKEERENLPNSSFELLANKRPVCATSLIVYLSTFLRTAGS